MNKKPGFQVKIDSETLLFIIIGIIIVLFVFFMPNIYKVIADLKTGNLFEKDDSPVINSATQNNQEEEKSEEPNSYKTLVCVKTDSEPDGNLVDTYTFYYNNDKLENIKNEKNYDAITDEYLNYVYSKQADFNKINDSYKDVIGFSYNSIVESRTLVATFIYDLMKLDLNDLKSEEETLNIELNVEENQSLESVEQVYTGLGYDCK